MSAEYRWIDFIYYMYIDFNIQLPYNVSIWVTIMIDYTNKYDSAFFAHAF